MIDPKVSALSDTFVPRALGVILFGLFAAIACASLLNPPVDPTCSDAAFSETLADCAAKAVQCRAAGGSAEYCGTVCDDTADAWKDRCGK